MKHHIGFRLIIILVFLLASGLGALALSTDGIDWSVISGGGGTISGGEIHMNSTIAQPVIGVSGGGDIALQAGYWMGYTGVTYLVYLPLIRR